MPLGIGYGTYGMPPAAAQPGMAPAPSAAPPPGMPPMPMMPGAPAAPGMLGAPGVQIQDPQVAQFLTGKSDEELAELVTQHLMKKAVGGAPPPAPGAAPMGMPQ
jgi:hypothetical protein